MILNKDYYEEFEIDLTGTCNLHCERCSRNYIHSQHLNVKNIRSLNDIINQINQFPNIKRCFLAGQVSEPTLYPDFIEFLKYLKSRNIFVDLFSNASILNLKLWEKIGKILDETDRVNFTICGSTQELHEKYRKGSKLENILKNAEQFRAVKKIDYCQYIKFTYNKEDLKNIKDKLGFTYFYVVDSEGDRLFNESINKIQTFPEKDNIIKYILKSIKDETELECRSLKTKKIYIDQFGNLYPCYVMAEYQKLKYNFNEKIDYSFLKENINCCKLCSKKCNNLMKMFNLDFVC